MHSPILAPHITLVLWSFAVLAWLYLASFPAMVSSAIHPDPHRPKEEFHAQLPVQLRWKLDNYNHLMEQPTLFYALTLGLAFLNEGAGLNAALAWLYVGLRIGHSVVQATINVILLRFAIFIAASLVLLALAIRAAVVVFAA